MRQLPSQYVLSKFFTYAGEPTFRKFDGIYNASCNICREGKSWLKKKRLFFYPDTSTFYCFNCSRSWNAIKWIEESTGMTRIEIELEAYNGDLSVDISEKILPDKIPKKEKPSLPYDSINLCDSLQQQYYQSNSSFLKAQEYVVQRRLNLAINRSLSYYISLTDYFHKDRLCIPYLDRNNKIVFYQTRSLDNTEPRYLNKIGYDKSVFGIERVKTEIDYIFLFEGPLDAMFTLNGVSLAGLTLTNFQEKQLSEFPFHEKIWILDNPAIDGASKNKIYELLKTKQKVFRWPLNSPYKDFNEWAVKEGINEIPYDFIIKNVYC